MSQFNWSESCWCYRCDTEARARSGDIFNYMRMNICPDCGNKRCPKATDHRNACTDSNESGQPGSRY